MRSGLPQPRVELEPHGPHFTFSLRRSQTPSADMWKQAMKKREKKAKVTEGNVRSKNVDVRYTSPVLILQICTDETPLSMPLPPFYRPFTKNHLPFPPFSFPSTATLAPAHASTPPSYALPTHLHRSPHPPRLPYPPFFPLSDRRHGQPHRHRPPRETGPQQTAKP